MKAVDIEHPHFSNIDVGVSEVERRRNHINEIDPNHPLLPIALGCIKDKATDRSNIQEVCRNTAAIKRNGPVHREHTNKWNSIDNSE